VRVLYENEGDAVYIPLRSRRIRVERSVCVDDRRIVDLGSDGEAVGIEILGASRGVWLADLVERFNIEIAPDEVKALERHWFQPMQYAPPFEGERGIST
jgi:uncharacterized protein YuzE